MEDKIRIPNEYNNPNKINIRIRDKTLTLRALLAKRNAWIVFLRVLDRVLIIKIITLKWPYVINRLPKTLSLV